MFMIWDSRQQDWQLFWLSFEHCISEKTSRYDYLFMCKSGKDVCWWCNLGMGLLGFYRRGYPVLITVLASYHDDVIKWKHFPRNWPFMRGIHRPPVNSPHKGQWRGTLMFTLICARINGWVNTREAGDLRRYRPHYDVIVMCSNNILYWHCLDFHLLFKK